MKQVYLSVTVEVPDDETDSHWPNIVNDFVTMVTEKGYSVSDHDWGEA